MHRTEWKEVASSRLSPLDWLFLPASKPSLFNSHLRGPRPPTAWTKVNSATYKIRRGFGVPRKTGYGSHESNSQSPSHLHEHSIGRWKQSSSCGRTFPGSRRASSASAHPNPDPLLFLLYNCTQATVSTHRKIEHYVRTDYPTSYGAQCAVGR